MSIRAATLLPCRTTNQKRKVKLEAFQQSQQEPCQAAAQSCTTHKHVLKMSMGLLGLKFPKTNLVLSLKLVTQADFRSCVTRKEHAVQAHTSLHLGEDDAGSKHSSDIT